MPCPFCMIASGIPPSPDPSILSSPSGSAYPVLSTPLVVAFLDIAPISRGHILLCPRQHRAKLTDMTVAEASGIGFWLPVLSRAVMRAVWGGEGGSWNIIQANGAEAGQTVPHSHFHVLPRSAQEGDASTVTDAERKNLALGEGPRAHLTTEDGVELSKVIKVELEKELRALKDRGDVEGDAVGALWVNTEGRGLKL